MKAKSTEKRFESAVFASRLIFAAIFYALYSILTVSLEAHPLPGDIEARNLTFQPEHFYLDIQGGGTRALARVDDKVQKFVTNQEFQEALVKTSPHEERRNIAGLSAANPAEPKFIGSQARVGLELAVTDWFGVGISYNATAVKVRDSYAPLDVDQAYYAIYQLQWLNGQRLSGGQPNPIGELSDGFKNYLDLNAAPGPLDYYKLIRYNGRLETVRSFDIEFGFHTGGSTFDVYTKLTFAVPGLLSIVNRFWFNDKVEKVGLLLGMRTFVGRFYFTTEIFADRYKSTGSGRSSGASSFGTVTHSGGARFGIGIAMDHRN